MHFCIRILVLSHVGCYDVLFLLPKVFLCTLWLRSFLICFDISCLLPYARHLRRKFWCPEKLWIVFMKIRLNWTQYRCILEKVLVCYLCYLYSVTCIHACRSSDIMPDMWNETDLNQNVNLMKQFQSSYNVYGFINVIWAAKPWF